ncbi:MAG: hypothetical protein Rubg2KO_08220 [Rubricoccaceae bacterium]
MAEWFEVYDAKGVLLRARRRATRLVWIYALVSGALVAAAPIAMFVLPRGGVAVAVTCAIGLVMYGLWLIIRLNQIHSKLWRFDVSVHRALGFDTGRRSRALAWPDVHQVEIESDGLTLVGRTHGSWVRLHVPTSFPHYTALAHRVIEYAEAHDRPVWLDGHPWQELDLVEVYPFIDHPHEAA